MGEAVTTRYRSSPILMGWWSVKCGDYRSSLVELANTTFSVKGTTKRGIIVQARGRFIHFLNEDANSPCRLDYTNYQNHTMASATAVCYNRGASSHVAMHPRSLSFDEPSAQKRAGVSA